LRDARNFFTLFIWILFWYWVQAHARAVETAQSVSKIVVKFFKTLDVHASNLTQIVEEAQIINDHKLSELEKKFEVVSVIKFKLLDGYTMLFCIKLMCFACTCRSVLRMKKDNWWRKWQSCLQVQMWGRKNW